MSRGLFVRLSAAIGLALGALAAPGLPAHGQVMEGLQVTSTSFGDGDYLPEVHILSATYGFGCAGGNVSPQLAWSGAPDGARSFAVTAFDPDAPTYAVGLDRLADVTSDTSAAVIGFMLHFNTLAKGEIQGFYKH